MRARGCALGAVLVLAAVAGCDDPFGPGACTTDVVAGIIVDLRREGGRSLLAEDAIGRAVDPDQPRVYEFSGYEDRLYGAHEAPGTYTVTVEKPGFVPWVREDVRVERGPCHVVTAELEAVLSPVP